MALTPIKWLPWWETTPLLTCSVSPFLSETFSSLFLYKWMLAKGYPSLPNFNHQKDFLSSKKKIGPPLVFRVVFKKGFCCIVMCERYGLLCRWHWKLLLWAGSPHETSQDTHDTQPYPQLWPLQKNGNLCKFWVFVLLLKYYIYMYYVDQSQWEKIVKSEALNCWINWRASFLDLIWWEIIFHLEL